jgi:hypothetical protein
MGGFMASTVPDEISGPAPPMIVLETERLSVD